MILIIDNYDSFTFNIVQYIGSLGVQSSVVRNDQISTDQIPSNTSHIIISPGPCTPSQAGISVDVVKSFSKKLPILGIPEKFVWVINRSDKPLDQKLLKLIT